MSELKSQPSWKKYYENAKPAPAEEARLVEVEKINKQDLFSETQTLDDIEVAIDAIGKVQEGSNIYTASELKMILGNIKNGSLSLDAIPKTFGLRAATNNALETIARQKYEQNLENLFKEFKILFEAKNFADVFQSFDIDDNKLDAEAALAKLATEYKFTSRLFQSGKLKNPDNSDRVSVEVREIAEKANAMLDAYRANASDALREKVATKSKEKLKNELTSAAIDLAIKSRKKIEVKAEYGSGQIGPGWIVTAIDNGEDITIKNPSNNDEKTVKLSELRKWNTFSYKPENVADPKADSNEKAAIEAKNTVVEKMEKDLETKKTADQEKADTKREKFEAKRIKMEESEKKKEAPKDLEEEKLLKEIDEARKKFAEIEYRERTSLERIRKFLHVGGQEEADIKRKLNSGPEEKERIKLEGKLKNTYNVQAHQKLYQDALKAFMEYEISKLKKSGLDGEDLKSHIKELYSFFNLDETIRYYDVRTEVKLEYLKKGDTKDGKYKNAFQEKRDKLHLKMKEASEWYNKKVPLKVKLGLAAVTFVPGVAFALGAAAPAAVVVAGVTGLALTRRAWGAMMVASSGGMFADKLIQGWDKKVDEGQRERDVRTLKEKGEIDYDKLKGILDGKIASIDDKLNKRNLSSSASKYLAFGAAIFSSVSLINSLSDFHGAMEASTTGISHAFKSVKGLWDHGAGDSNTGGTKEIVESWDPKKQDFTNISKTRVPGVVETPASPALALPATEELKIVKGSSIEATLRDYYRTDGMEHKLSGAEAHREFVNYMNDKITAMKTALAEKPEDVKLAAKLKEYREMLKTGRATVHAGDKIFVDANGKLTDIQVDPKYGDIKMPHGVHHHAPHIEHQHVASAQHIETSGVEPEPSSPVSEDSSPRFEESGKQIYLEDSTDQQTAPEPFKTSGPEIYLDKTSAGLSREALNNLVAGDRRVTNPNLLRDLFSSGASKEKILKTCLAEFTKGEGVNWSEVKDVKIADLIQNRPGVRTGMRTLATNFRPLVGERLAGDRSFAFSDKVLNQTPKQWLAGVVSAASKNRVV